MLDAPPIACVVATVKQLQSENLPTTHMISIGGWNAPHPVTTNPKTGKGRSRDLCRLFHVAQSYTAAQVYAAWNTWNTGLATQYDWNGFDGLDWDMEGANEVRVCEE